MSNTFANLRKKSNGIEDIRNKFKKLQNNGGGRNPTLEDETFWDIKHVRGSDGTGIAIVRFLPAPPNEDDPIVKVEEYNHKGPGGYYINLSRRTLGADQADPAYEYNGTVFGDSSLNKEEKMKKLVNRKETYIAGIEVISDPNQPENEGKRFRWRFGPQIYNIVNAALFPEIKSDEPINVFDPLEGANFELRVITKKIPDRTTGKMTDVPSYEKSKFKDPSVYMDLEEFEEVWQELLPLKTIISEDKFKSYEELKKELDRALKVPATRDEEDEENEEPRKETPREKKTSQEPKKSTKKEEPIDEIPFEFPDSNDKSEVVEEVVEETTDNSGDDIDDWLDSLKK